MKNKITIYKYGHQDRSVYCEAKKDKIDGRYYVDESPKNVKLEINPLPLIVTFTMILQGLFTGNLGAIIVGCGLFYIVFRI